jgi:glycerol uptake facilitator-like aquaporin
MLAEFFGTFVLVLLGLGTCTVNTVGLPGSGRQTAPFGPDNWLINVFGWAAMMRTPEPGLAPVPTTAAAWGVAGPVTAEDSAEAEKDQAA